MRIVNELIRVDRSTNAPAVAAVTVGGVRSYPCSSAHGTEPVAFAGRVQAPARVEVGLHFAGRGEPRTLQRPVSLRLFAEDVAP